MKDISRRLLLALKSFSVVLLVAGTICVGDAGAQGEQLFKANCSSCHKVNQNMTGPALQGVQDRWKGKEDLLHEWIKNPAAVKAQGDPYVNKLLAQWEGKSGLMTAQNVSDDDIDAILQYVEDWQPDEKNVADGGAGGGTAAPTDQGFPTIWLIIIFFLLLILVFSLVSMRSSLGRIGNVIRESEGLPAEPEPNTLERLKLWMSDNKVFVSVVGILVVVYFVVAGYEALMGIGVYQGYTPEQPILFNHTLHAGTNEVACVYCHSSALKGKNAGIPSVNVCMNCHKSINEGQTKEGTAEIQKIYDAIGWDPEAQEYNGEEHPIKWVKVHNLPDLVYFNHAQHYVVGQIACQECHGQIQEEYVVAGQESLLTMGWCIECHNKTQVQMTNNGYYEEVHKRLVENGKDELKEYLEDGAITAKELGGWECAKCHY